MSALHQISAGYTRGDAIANEARVLRSLFRSWGFESDIFAETDRILPELRKDARDIRELPGACRPDDAVLLHLSIGSIVNDVFAQLPCRKAVLYHNITPPHFFQGINQEVVRHLVWGREQARALAGRADVVMAVSRYNADELAAMGHADIRVVPLLPDIALWRAPPDKRMLNFLKDGKVNVLFVGRCAPNKRIEDLLAAFYYFQRFVEANSRLIHVGAHAGMERYHALLLAKTHALQLQDVLFCGSLKQTELNACYAASHIFLCMSEHEGFCIPLLEAMAHAVPVLAHASAAVPETLDGAGVLFAEKRYDWIAETMGEAARNTHLNRALVMGQRNRLERYLTRDLAAEMRAALAPLLRF